MDKKYFFFDIDQTLGLGITQVVPPDAQACLDALQAAGHFVALATGRIQCDAAAFAQKHGIRSLVADGGNSLTVAVNFPDMAASSIWKACRLRRSRRSSTA